MGGGGGVTGANVRYKVDGLQGFSCSEYKIVYQ